MSYGRAIFGDNQFLGVNHSNQARAAELFERFKHPDAILEVLAAAHDAGVRDFMFTTHDRYVPVFDEIRRSRLFPGMHYTPCLPYAHKYWNQLSSKGPSALIASTIMQINPLRIVPATFGMLLGRTRGVTALLTEIETLMCRGLPVRGVFLQNLAFDFLMAMDLHRIIEDFADTVSRRLGALPGFITMNHPKAVELLCDRVGLERPWVCANFNQAGFRMNPSQAACEQSFASGRSHNIAMSVFSSGQSDPGLALDYVVSRLDAGSLDAILFGSSSRSNINANLAQINRRAGPL
ncbi:MAG: hypothetical protein JNJ60_17065 [Rhodocyclaceae bacterium]|nr:hypothetical protein [Rhodocyclaceae bacterium]